MEKRRPTSSESLPNCQPNDIATGSDEMKTNNGDHSYAKPYVDNPYKVYRCSNCAYYSAKKYNVMKHETSSHGVKAVRDMQCQVCKKLFDYDGLRCHLNYSIPGKYKSKNEHSELTQQEHKMMLLELKQQKNK